MTYYEIFILVFFFNKVENPSRKSYIFYYIYFINILLNIIEIKITLLR